jgi:hypothetical protein
MENTKRDLGSKPNEELNMAKEANEATGMSFLTKAAIGTVAIASVCGAAYAAYRFFKGSEE